MRCVCSRAIILLDDRSPSAPLLLIASVVDKSNIGQNHWHLAPPRSGVSPTSPLARRQRASCGWRDIPALFDMVAGKLVRIANAIAPRPCTSIIKVGCAAAFPVFLDCNPPISLICRWSSARDDWEKFQLSRMHSRHISAPPSSTLLPRCPAC